MVTPTGSHGANHPPPSLNPPCPYGREGDNQIQKYNQGTFGTHYIKSYTVLKQSHEHFGRSLCVIAGNTNIPQRGLAAWRRIIHANRTRQSSLRTARRDAVVLQLAVNTRPSGQACRATARAGARNSDTAQMQLRCSSDTAQMQLGCSSDAAQMQL